MIGILLSATLSCEEASRMIDNLQTVRLEGNIQQELILEIQNQAPDSCFWETKAPN